MTTAVTKNIVITTALWLALVVVAVVFSRSLLQAHTPSAPKLAQTQGISTTLVAPPPVVSTATVAPPPSSKVVAPPAKATHRTTSAKPQPVVTPSPTSKVSGLAPVAPTAGGSGGAPATAVGYTSTNWSGYLATSGTFSAVSAAWTVPTITGAGGTESADSTWVGIGGVTSGDLVQVGTYNIVEPGGQVDTQAFYELLPALSQAIPAMTVSQGDSITAGVSEVSAGQWQIHIADSTTGQSFNTTVAYSSSHSSAEWIEEDPSSSFRHLIPLDNFGTAQFSGGTAVVNGSATTISGSNSLPVTMVDRNGQNIAIPSVISGGGSGFSVSRVGS